MLDAVDRILRKTERTQGAVLIALHLSRIGAAGPRAHHRRVAAAVLDDAAGRTGGQLFALANGDMALLFRPTDRGVVVAAMICRLFQADAPRPEMLRSVWPLPDFATDALDYCRARVADGDGAQPPPEPQASASVIAAMDSIVQTASLGDLMIRQTAALLRPGGLRAVPLFREVAISTAVLEARIAAVGQANADPFLFSHLAARLDRRMLTALLRDIPGNGTLSGRLDGAALHVNLTLSGILSDGFATFAQACQGPIAAGLPIGVEVPFVEVFADPKAFLLARERLRLSHLRLVLDGVTHQAMALTSPAVLKPDLVKLIWSPALLDDDAALTAAISRLGPEHVVLHQVDAEAAVTWGRRRGIHRYQGRYVDVLLAAQRLAGCAHARGCTMRQCTERASATGPAGRAGCTNTALLDAASPSFVMALSA